MLRNPYLGFFRIFLIKVLGFTLSEYTNVKAPVLPKTELEVASTLYTIEDPSKLNC
jgi:hypothetical protein